jgi:energy-coupling factor transporter ATP-binding protein EcfA2
MDAQTIPVLTKRKFVAALSEDDFRDTLVRPLFLRKGFVHGAELCGPTEAGKDCFFRAPAPFSGDYIAVVQTKIGNLNMGREPSKNVEEAATQLRTAMAAMIQDIKTKKKRRPNFGYLCSSGQINEQAKAHVLDTVKNPNLTFLDIDDLIPEIDSHFPEFWHGISADKFPYLKRLEEKLLTESEFASLTALIKSSEYNSPISDTGFVPLKLGRTFLKTKKSHGVITQEPEFEETNLEELIRRPGRRFLILGEAGSGKTTLLKRLAEILCRQGMQGHDTYIPVVLKALDIAGSESSLAEQVLSATESLTLSGAAAFGVAEIDNGKVCVLIDALDEVGTQATFNRFMEKLVAFDGHYSNCKVIIAARNYSYITSAEGLAAYVRYNVSPIGLKEATQIIKNLGKKKLIESDRATEVMRQLESIHGFDLNPLVVTVFAASADSTRRDIPSNITELFAKFTEFMLGRWDTEKGLSQQYEANLKALLLQKIAYKMHKEKKVRLPSQDFRALIELELAELGVKEAKVDVLLDEILNRSTLLRDVDGCTEFRHVLIQEFFAGRGIADVEALPKYATDEWWRRALVFYFGSNPKDYAGLKSLCRVEIAHTPVELFNLGVTLGLATQACYFVKLREKADLIGWTIRALASSTSTLLEDDLELQYPIHAFVYSYLVGRDAVAADCTAEIALNTPSLALEGNVTAELEEFWLIVGLMDSGHLATAFERIRKYRPSKPLALLPLNMGAFLIEQIRSGSKEHKRIAGEIVEHTQPTITPLIRKYLKEFKSHLLEIQKGEVRELPANIDEAPLL